MRFDCHAMKRTRGEKSPRPASRTAGAAAGAGAGAARRDRRSPAKRSRAGTGGAGDRRASPARKRTLNMTVAEALGRAALDADMLSHGLARPAFRPTAAAASAVNCHGDTGTDGFFATGSMVAPDGTAGRNFLVFSKVDFERKTLGRRSGGTTRESRCCGRRRQEAIPCHADPPAALQKALVHQAHPLSIAANGVALAMREMGLLCCVPCTDDETVPVCALPVAWRFPAADPIHALEWTNERALVVAMGRRLAMIIPSVELSGRDDDPEVADVECDILTGVGDDVRDLCVHPTQRHLVAVGGFDKRVSLTDVDARKTSAVACGDVVGSLAWHGASVISATTDAGFLKLVDVRGGSASSWAVGGRTSKTFDTHKPELYSHAYLDSNRVCLGYGDASVSVWDLRKWSVPVVETKDTYQTAVGDVSAQDDWMVLTGAPGVSLWYTAASPAVKLSIKSHHRAADVPEAESANEYSVSGCFVRGTSVYAAADTLGNVLVLSA